MTSKFLEISSGHNLPPKKFEIVEVGKDNFMLKTKNSHDELRGTLQKWLQSNNSMEELTNKDLLRQSSNSTIKEAD